MFSVSPLCKTLALFRQTIFGLVVPHGSTQSTWSSPSIMASLALPHASNYFVGTNKFLIPLSLLPIQAGLGMGILFALIIPFKLSLAAITLFLGYPIVNNYLISKGIISNPQHARHPIIPNTILTVDKKEDFVCFIIGAKYNGPFPLLDQTFKWIGDSFREMVQQLESEVSGESGYLGGESLVSCNPEVSHTASIQYWQSQEHLNKFAKSGQHLKVMSKMIGISKQSSLYGIYHESYRISAGSYDCIYQNMPAMGLGGTKGAKLIAALGKKKTAAGRAGLKEWDDWSKVSELKQEFDQRE